MTKPREMKGTIEGITRVMLAEVRRRQPEGPYYFGGWRRVCLLCNRNALGGWPRSEIIGID